VLAPVRITLARLLEGGRLATPVTRALAHFHATFARNAVARPLNVAAPAIVTITVGGATIGGSGKTRVALACARELARLGARVVLVGHAYRAAPQSARVVAATDRLELVGDEALLCARELADMPTARVVVGPTRQAAVDLAVSLSPGIDALVLDGPLQLAPVKATLALLAVDATAPWGAGHVLPAGDLRAPREALLAAADSVVEVDATPSGAFLHGRAFALTDLAALLAPRRIGLFTAIARPERLARALATAGIQPSIVVRASDHGPLTPRLRRQLLEGGADLWLATAKCALHLEGLDDLHVAVLDGRTMLPTSTVLALHSAWPKSSRCLA
jgi:tetraacyldisaccharide 4'-kinase